MLDDGEGFGFGENYGEAVRLFGADHIGGGFDFFKKDVTVEEENGAQRLILGGRGDAAFDCQVRNEGLDFKDAHFGGVALVVVKDITLAPVDIGLFGAIGVVFGADGIPKLVEELFPLWGRVCWRGWLFRHINSPCAE